MTKDPDALVDLTSAATEFEANVMVRALESRGIPARAFTTAGAMLQWDVASSQPMRVAVRRQDLEQARVVLAETRSDSVDIDWSEVDVGDPEPDDASVAGVPRRLFAPGTVLRFGGYAALFVVALAWGWAFLAFGAAALIEAYFWRTRRARS